MRSRQDSTGAMGAEGHEAGQGQGQETTPDPAGSVAIIGMSCRFPGAATVAAFWRNLREGVESIKHFSDEELDRAVIDPAELGNPRYVKARAVLDGIDRFDAHFFDFSPREAEITDPQQRVLLECAWEAFESAGYEPTIHPRPIGVFAGAGANGYLLYNLSSAGHLVGTVNAFQAVIHNKNDHVATRLAYKLNLKGPAVTVQTACSTSLVGVVLACQSLLSYQCDMALAGGVTITVPQNTGYLYTERGIGSPDGHCRAFDARAQGTVGGSGAGVVILKRLEDALADGDTIHAVIRGGAINNDGSLKVGYTAPSVDGQAEVIAMAQALAEVNPETISYVEAHGTGTPLGDPIEIQALTQAFRRHTGKRQYCAIGSVKTQVGHLDTAAGVAGLIKTVLALEHRSLPPSLHFEAPNPEIDFAESPFYVNDRLRDWPAGPEPRRAGVSSFGLGGTNAHVVLEEAPDVVPGGSGGPGGPARPLQLVLLSAKTDGALEAATAQLGEYLRTPPQPGASAVDLADVAYTLHAGRKAFAHRRMFVCRDRAEAATLLGTLEPERVYSRVQEPIHRPLTFMFPGQGAQYPGMGAELYRGEPVFREEVDRCLAIFDRDRERQHGVALRDVLLPGTTGGDGGSGALAAAGERLKQTALAQPALFVIEYALAKLWMSWGVQPTSMIGHSVGEYVAACLAGVFSLEDALGLIAARGRLIQGLPAGAMLIVPLPEREVLTLLGAELSLAAVNGPELCVVSGPAAAVDALEARLTGRGVICRRLHTSHAFHSAMMDPILGEFRQVVARAERKAPRLPFLSNVTGTWITAEEAQDPEYWTRHLRQTVRFAAGLDVLLAEPEAVLLEVGPGRTLRTIARWNPKKKPAQFMLASLPHPDEGQTDYGVLLHAIGHLWLAGIEVDPEALYAGQKRRRRPLPTYPFERQRYWVDLRPGAGQGHRLAGSLEKQSDVSRWFYVPVWKEVPRGAAGLRVSTGDQGPWLVFVDALGFGERFVAGLQRDGHEVVTVRAGEGFRLLDEHHSEVHPRRREDYEALLTALRERGRFPTRIVHFWSLAPGEVSGDRSGRDVLEGGSQLEAQLDGGFFSLLGLAQALGSVPGAMAGPASAASGKGPQTLDLMVVTNNAQEVVGGDLTRPEQATVRGPCLVIPREYPNVRCRHVDIALPPPRSVQAERLVEALRGEMQMDDKETVVAYRGGHRWVQAFESLPLTEPAGARLPLREQGVYLITGGLGGLGLTFAEDLARTQRARLVLVGRSPLPERSNWAQALATGDEAVKRKIRRVQALEALGAEVLVGQADVGDLEALRRVVADAQRQFGAIHGVIHAAGVAGGGMIQRKSREAALEVLWPKVRGAQVLAAVTAGCELDFFLLCSSLTTAVPRFGQVDYTAANAFLDAFAQQVAQSGRLAVAVDWGAWDEVGMAARNTEGGERPLRVIDHPLLERCLREEPGREVYATDYNVDKHWVLDEHRILGNPVIPGVAYFEMVRAALDERVRGRSVRFEDVFFLAPLRVRDGETREVRLVLEQDDESHFRFAIRSREGQGEGQGGAAAKLRDFTIGSVALLEAGPAQGHEPPAGTGRKLDIDELRRRCNVQELLLPAEQREEDLGPRWHSVQRVYIGHNEVLLLLELPEAFAADFDRMKFHPALLDRAAGIAKNFLAREGAYLPLNYKKLTIHDRLQRKIYSYARFHEEESADRETITFDIALMDEHGRVLVDIERFAQKRVNDPGSEIRALAAAARPVAEDEPERREEIRPKEGVAALRRILATAGATAVNPRVVVSVRDLQASIEQTDQVIQERILAAAEQQRTPGGVRPRPALKNDYVPPRNEIERRIAAAWQEILGVERVGIHDNFFDLGGDSVQAIQIIAKASHAGVQLNPQQFFQYATIAELGEMLAGILAEQADQGAIVGPVPLTPAQHAFLVGHATPERHNLHYEGLLLELSEALDAAVLREAVKALLGHHDALRLRFVREAAGWQQVSATVSDTVAWTEIDLSALTEEAQKERLPVIVEETAAGLRLGAGPVFIAARIRRGGGQRDLLLLLAHRLVVDGPSWRILLSDLQSVCQTHQIKGGKGSGRLPPKTTPFKAWAERLVAQATAVPGGETAALWTGDEWKGVAPLFGESSGVSERPVRALTVSLSPEQTRALVDEVQPTYRATMSEILATGLLLSLAAATGRTSWIFGVVGDAREAFAELDLSRTVGWFATTYPVRLEHEAQAPLGEVLQSVKTQLRRTTGHAASYDLLRAGDDGRKDLPRAEIELCYWGSVDELAPAAAGLVPLMPIVPGAASISVVRSLGLDADRRLRVEGLLRGGRLELRWVYDEVACTSALVERFAQECLRSLATLIEHGRTSEAHASPTDFPLADLDESQLGALAELIDQADQLDS